ncbi:acyl-CoA dehydrogenase family protein [Martelella sp. FOR1707]
MSIINTPENLAFREEVRSFIRDNLPAELSNHARYHSHSPKEHVVRWHKILHARGWGAPSWPKEFGGTGWSAAKRYIFEEEAAASDAPALSPFGLGMIGPVLYTFGTDEQKERFLPRILSMDDIWCQGFSEPGAGSDLASLKTRATREGDDFIVNGSKIWTSDAHRADWMFCLVRTNPEGKPQAGISMLLIDMKSPGATVRPIIGLDGGHSLNEVFLDSVRVPAANLVGEENKGWTYAKFLLAHERVLTADVGRSKRRLAILKEVLAEETTGPTDPYLWRKVAALEIQLLALESLALETVEREHLAEHIAAEPSILKLRGSNLLQAILELTVDALGYDAIPFDPDAASGHDTPAFPTYAAGLLEEYFYRRAATVYGGSNETQKNIVSKLILNG